MGGGSGWLVGLRVGAVAVEEWHVDAVVPVTWSPLWGAGTAGRVGADLRRRLVHLRFAPTGANSAQTRYFW